MLHVVAASWKLSGIHIFFLALYKNGGPGHEAAREMGLPGYTGGTQTDPGIGLKPSKSFVGSSVWPPKGVWDPYMVIWDHFGVVHF